MCQGPNPSVPSVRTPHSRGTKKPKNMSTNTYKKELKMIINSPGILASMFVTAIKVPAKFGARSLWLEKTPENILP